MKRLGFETGYTIVEVMIFLAISGILLITGLLAFNGRQQRVRFTQGVREVEAQIKTVINETASGFYPGRGELQCSSANGSGPLLSTAPTGTTVEQGTNAGCIFLGRVIEFSSGENYYAYTVVGQRVGQNGQDVTSLGSTSNQARQKAVVPASGQASSPDITATYKIPGGLEVNKVLTSSASAPTVAGFSFITSFANYSGNDLVSGTSNLNLYVLAGTSLQASDQDPAVRNNAMAAHVQNNLASDPVNPGPTIVCLQESGGGRRAAIIIGGVGNITSTEVLIDGVPAGCN